MVKKGQQLFQITESPKKNSRCGPVKTTQKMKFSIKDFFSKCKEICSFLRIWSHLLKKSLMENFIFSAVTVHMRESKKMNLSKVLKFLESLFEK